MSRVSAVEHRSGVSVSGIAGCVHRSGTISDDTVTLHICTSRPDITVHTALNQTHTEGDSLLRLHLFYI